MMARVMSDQFLKLSISSEKGTIEIHSPSYLTKSDFKDNIRRVSSTAILFGYFE